MEETVVVQKQGERISISQTGQIIHSLKNLEKKANGHLEVNVPFLSSLLSFKKSRISHVLSLLKSLGYVTLEQAGNHSSVWHTTENFSHTNAGEIIHDIREFWLNYMDARKSRKNFKSDDAKRAKSPRKTIKNKRVVSVNEKTEPIVTKTAQKTMQEQSIADLFKQLQAETKRHEHEAESLRQMIKDEAERLRQMIKDIDSMLTFAS